MILKRFIEQLPPQVFKDFLLQQVLPNMLKILSRPDLDMNDAGTAILLNEMVALQQMAFQKYGDEVLINLEQVILPSQLGPGNYINTYLQLLRSNNPKDFKDFFRTFVKAFRKEKLKL